jgi:hypothetical protein
MWHLLTNQIAYLIYFVLLILIAFGLAIIPHLPPRLTGNTGNMVVTVDATVQRGPQSLKIIHGTFVVITVINLGIAQVVFPFLPPRISRFSFVMIIFETLAWAYLVYVNAWTRNKLIGLVQWAATDR